MFFKKSLGIFCLVLFTYSTVVTAGNEAREGKNELKKESKRKLLECQEKVHEIKKKMINANTKEEKNSFKSQLEVARQCRCKVKEETIANKIKSLKNRLAKLEEKQAKLKCRKK